MLGQGSFGRGMTGGLVHEYARIRDQPSYRAWRDGVNIHATQ
jgi:hypothetical protein